MSFSTSEGNEENLTFQIAEVNKALGAISYLVDRGYRVTFDKNMKTGQDLSVMLNKSTGTSSRFRRDKNVWILDVYVNAVEQGNDGQGFGRRG